MLSIKISILFLVLSSIVLVSDAAFIIAGLIAIKAAIIGGLIVGGIAGGIIGGAARARHDGPPPPPAHHHVAPPPPVHAGRSFQAAPAPSFRAPAPVQTFRAAAPQGPAQCRVRHPGHQRFGRSITDIDELFLFASQNDADDCAKKLICSLAAKDVNTLAQDEAVIVSLFGQSELDVSKTSIEFDLAATMGRKVGSDHCNSVYSRCGYTSDSLMEVMRQPDLNEI